jgi:hypothetical protein
MKKFFAVVVVIILVIAGINAFRDQSTSDSLVTGDRYEDDKHLVVVIEGVMRGDSVLLKYPNVFNLTDDMLTQQLVISRSEKTGQLFAQHKLWFAHNHVRVHSTIKGGTPQ